MNGKATESDTGQPTNSGGHQGLRESIVRGEREPVADSTGAIGGSGHERGAIENTTPERADRVDTPALSAVISDELPAAFAAEMAVLNGDTERAETERAEIIANVNAVQAAVDSAYSEIRSEVVNCINECNRDQQSCIACIVGQVGVSADGIDTVIGKAVNKIVRPIDQSITQSYLHSYPVFGQPPTTEEVYEAITGKQLPTGADLDRPPPSTDTIPPPPVCPPGTAPQWDGMSRQWVCVGSPIVPPPPPPPPIPVTECRILPPPEPGPSPVPDDGPPCPQPDEPCPVGTSWVWRRDVQAWQCRPNDEPREDCGDVKCTADDDGLPANNESGLNFCDDKNAGQWHLASEVTVQASKDPPAFFLRAANLPIIGPAIEALGSLFISAAERETVAVSCHSNTNMFYIIERSLMGFFSSWFGVQWGPVAKRRMQQHNFACPVEIPSPDEADLMFSRNIIDEQTHTNLRRVNELCPQWADDVRKAKRPLINAVDALRLKWRRVWTDGEYEKHIRQLGYLEKTAPADIERANLNKLTLIDYVNLYRRGEIKTPEEFFKKVEELGIGGQDTYWTLKLSEWLPSPTDLIPLMVRDVFDQNIVDKYNYDHEFEQKYLNSPQALRIGKANGVEPETMRLFWRSHWRNPSPSQLYECLRRLRPDSTDPQARANAITADDVRTFLQIDDVQPFWIPKLMAISYNPMRLVDLRNAYDMQALTDEVIVSRLKDLGYNEETVKDIMVYWDVRRRRSLLNISSGLTARKVVAYFKDRIIGRDQALNLLLGTGLRIDQANELLDDAEAERDLVELKGRVAALKKRYKVGDFGPGDIERMLIAAGLSTEDASHLATVWEQELQHRGKEIAASTLCRWRFRGMITPDEQFIRLRRVGYSDLDARRIVGTCEQDNTVHRFREELMIEKGVDYRNKKAEKGRKKPNGQKP